MISVCAQVKILYIKKTWRSTFTKSWELHQTWRKSLAGLRLGGKVSCALSKHLVRGTCKCDDSMKGGCAINICCITIPSVQVDSSRRAPAESFMLMGGHTHASRMFRAGKPPAVPAEPQPAVVAGAQRAAAAGNAAGAPFVGQAASEEAAVVAGEAAQCKGKVGKGAKRAKGEGKGKVTGKGKGKTSGEKPQPSQWEKTQRKDLNKVCADCKHVKLTQSDASAGADRLLKEIERSPVLQCFNTAAFLQPIIDVQARIDGLWEGDFGREFEASGEIVHVKKKFNHHDFMVKGKEPLQLQSKFSSVRLCRSRFLATGTDPKLMSRSQQVVHGKTCVPWLGEPSLMCVPSCALPRDHVRSGSRP